MGDYPDWTGLAQIIGTDIMVACDIQGGYIMLPVDIQGQYIDLDINIKSQSVNINIDIDAQSVGIYLQADWSALQGTDKNIYTFAINQPRDGGCVSNYNVPADKTLFICGFSIGEYSQASADYDHFLYVSGWVYNSTTTVVLARICGVGGHSVTFPKPLVVPGGNTVQVYAENDAGVSVVIFANAWGFEI